MYVITLKKESADSFFMGGFLVSLPSSHIRLMVQEQAFFSDFSCDIAYLTTRVLLAF